jgi:DNA polymerase-3 subunit alpha
LTEFSFLDGRARTSELANQAKVNGDEACAITDHDEVGGHLDFQAECNKAGVKPIFGTEARWLRDIEASRKDKTRGFDDSHIVLLAADRQGLHNLWALSSLAYEERNFYGKPQLTPELMRQYRDGLWASDGCFLTRFAEHVYRDEDDLARQELGVLLDIFGDKFYMELHTWRICEPREDDELKFYGQVMTSMAANELVTKVNHAKVDFAKQLGVPLVVVNDCHYARKGQWREHRLVWAINTFKGDQTDTQGQAADWMMSTDDIGYWMGQHGIDPAVTAEAIKNTSWIADQCEAQIRPHLSMPRLHASDEEDRDAFLQGVREGFKRKIIDRVENVEAYIERLNYEVDLILSKGMAGYFNVVADYTLAGKTGSYKRWIEPGAGDDPCLCGPGRGSGGGSLVNYVLDITSLDPIHYDLMFERFINPDRQDPPDIDVDFPKTKRLGLKKYLGKRYGEDRVVSIGTRSRSGPKQMLADLAKALPATGQEREIPFADLKEMRRLIEEIDKIPEEDDDPDAEVITWDEVLQQLGGELKPWAARYPVLFERMGQLNGLARQSGVHAAGIIVSNEPLLGHIPTRRKPGGTGTLATQWDMHEIEWLGGVKDDLLAIRHLDTCETARRLVYERRRIWLDFDGSGIGTPDDAREVIHFGPQQYADPKIWEPIWRGETLGIFQIGTGGATRQATRFKPTNERDMADLIAINRPGVIRAGLLDTYLRRRRGEEQVTFDHPMMEPITGHTHGVLVYQEDLIKAARQLAEFSAGDAEWLRKIIGKKLVAEMARQEQPFLDGCLSNPEFMAHWSGNELPTDEQFHEAARVVRRIWASLKASGAYAFNRSHAMGYAVLACWECWLKRYCYDEWVAACLATDRPEKVNRYVREARRRERPILPPDVNLSAERFLLTPDGIRYGLTDIRDIGPAAMKDILAHRPYASLADYLERVRDDRGGKKQVVENLIALGAFGCFDTDRSKLLREYWFRRCLDEVAPLKRSKLTAEQANQIVKDKQSARPDEFVMPRFSDPKVLYGIEKELVGTFVTIDPMAPYLDAIEAECIQHPSEIDEQETGEKFIIGGELIRVSPHKQKNGKAMAFLTVQWAEEEFEIMAFADAWAAGKTLLKVGEPVACEVVKLKGRGCHLAHVERLDMVWLDD